MNDSIFTKAIYKAKAIKNTKTTLEKTLLIGYLNIIALFCLCQIRSKKRNKDIGDMNNFINKLIY